MSKENFTTGLPDDGVYPETIAELAQLIQVDWFPGSATSAGAKPGLSPSSRRTMVEAIQRMGVRARFGGPRLNRDAVLNLFIVTCACHIQMMLLAEEKPQWVRQAFFRSLFFPVGQSPVAVVGSIFRNIGRLIAVGRFFLQMSSAKANLNRTVNACAFQLLGFMVLARRGFVSDDRYLSWVARCAALKPLSSEAWPAWRRLATEIAGAMFPDLANRLFHANAGTPKHYRGDATTLLNRACDKIWTLFLVVEGEAQEWKGQPPRTA